MKILYFDCYSGISGDMVLGALVDAGVNIDDIREQIEKLGLKGYEMTAEKVKKHGMTGTRVRVVCREEKEERTFSDIRKLIKESRLPENIKKRIVDIFTKIADAEAVIHGTSPEKVTFHEVGALDSIIDITASVIGMEILNPDEVVSSPIHCGRGTVHCRHGEIPVPVPATVEILKGKPVYSTGVEHELVTPTGAAILSTYAERYGEMPCMSINKAGYGAGTRDTGMPNFLRVLVGESQQADRHNGRAVLLETNIDDMNPEHMGYVIERLFEKGALDVFTTGVQMKKNRPGTKISVLAIPENKKNMMDILFKETTTLGVRISEVERQELDREQVSVATDAGEVSVKVARYNGKIVNISPEYSSCRELAVKTGIPIKDIYKKAVLAFEADASKGK